MKEQEHDDEQEHTESKLHKHPDDNAPLYPAASVFYS
jgi:hypothetical protein